MSEATPTQPVVTETNAQPQAGAEVTDARTEGADLDTLLKTYDEQTTTTPATPPTPAQAPAADPDLKALAGEVQQMKGFVNEANKLRFQHDMNATVETIRGDLDPEIFDAALVKGWLNAQAEEDPRLAQAWLERHANPKHFEQVKAALAKNFAKKFSKMPDRQATEDREAVTAHMRGASTRTPEDKPVNYAGMSNNDAAADIEKKYGYRPAF